MWFLGSVRHGHCPQRGCRWMKWPGSGYSWPQRGGGNSTLEGALVNTLLHTGHWTAHVTGTETRGVHSWLFQRTRKETHKQNKKRNKQKTKISTHTHTHTHTHTQQQQQQQKTKKERKKREDGSEERPPPTHTETQQQIGSQLAKSYTRRRTDT